MVNVQNEMQAFEVKGYEEDWVLWKMRWKLKYVSCTYTTLESQQFLCLFLQPCLCLWWDKLQLQ